MQPTLLPNLPDLPLLRHIVSAAPRTIIFYIFFTITAGKSFFYVQQWLAMMQPVADLGGGGNQTVSISVKIFFFFFWRPPDFGRKNV